MRGTLLERFDAKYIPEPNSGCWLWEAAYGSRGYGCIGVEVEHGRWAIEDSHRVSWKLHRGKIPEGKCVLHHCDNRPCVNPDHLYIGTKLDNARDRERRNRQEHPRGEDSPSSKLTLKQALEIKLAPESSGLAAKYGVTRQVISGIRRGAMWKNIGD